MILVAQHITLDPFGYFKIVCNESHGPQALETLETLKRLEKIRILWHSLLLVHAIDIASIREDQVERSVGL